MVSLSMLEAATLASETAIGVSGMPSVSAESPAAQTAGFVVLCRRLATRMPCSAHWTPAFLRGFARCRCGVVAATR